MDIKTRREKRKEAKQKILLTAAGVFILTAAIIYICINTELIHSNHTSTDRSSITLDLDTEINISVKEDLEQKMAGVVNIALFGLDRRGTEPCRTDTIMICSIDKGNKKIKLISLMRDMYVDIPGKWNDRINAAYAYGGPDLAVSTINKNFDMDIKNYVSVDFKGLHRLINKLDGVDIDIKEGEIEYLNDYLDSLNSIDSENPEPNITQPGMQHLRGKQALSYMRIRYFGDGDYERTERQRRVTSQLFNKIKRFGIFKFPDIVTSVMPYVDTNISKTDIMSLGIIALGFKNEVEQYRLPVDGTFSNQYIRGMAVLVPDIKTNTEQLHEFIYNKRVHQPLVSTP